MPADITTFTIGSGPNAIEFLIMANEPYDYSNGESGPARSVTYRVDGGLGAKACDALYGVGVYIITTPGGGFFQNPHRFPNNTALTCHSVRGKPLGTKMPDPQLMHGTYDVIEANYAINYWDTDGSEHATTDLAGVEVPWSRLTRKGSSMDIPVKPAALKNADGTEKPAQNFNVHVPIQEYVWERGMLPNFEEFDTILQGLEGKMNQYEFFGFPPKTLLLDSSDSEQQFDAAGARKQRFSMVIRHRAYAWDTSPSEKDPSVWEQWQTEESDNPLLQVADFSPLVEYLTVAAGTLRRMEGWRMKLRRLP